ncbi:hypothetical protein L0P88_07510 [Muricauda sp. SCSIO 64092]|uniref:hypothetical protein n=1 Tax=Allomuricauda sp. SCSIO 64092 TaxID=2908842 RepID=UPI001FF2E0A6|nr:hypothetical protein [Muricauda sp. SCSIO 64092]UOY08394.1 hypothetical protein L0P88_07510 [Muricauda sp. SCSIO 64092]
MRNWTIVVVIGLLLGCGGGDDGPPPSPEGAVLVFPFENSECTTGVDLTEDLSQVTFEWQPANNTDNYTLTVINLLTNIPQTISTSSTSAALSIEKGAPFSWSILSTNNESDETATSESWLFYNAGSQTTYAPFPAQIRSPEAGSTVQATANGVVLSWTGADVEGDIETFEVYFSENNPPETLLITTDAQTMETMGNVVSGQIYYWKVITIDAEGNRSDSGVFDFKVF